VASDEVRREFIDALEELYPELHRYEKPDRDMGVWLSQSLYVNADDDCLRAISADMRNWTERSKRGDFQ
jgi:hypothetical protein